MLLFSKDTLNWSKVTVILQTISISNKCCSFELSIHLWILENKMYHSFDKKILVSIYTPKNIQQTTVVNTDNNQKLLWSNESNKEYNII